MIIYRVLLQGFEKSFPPLDDITELLINIEVVILERGVEVRMRGSGLIGIIDGHADVSSFLILGSLLPHQLIDIFLQFRQSIQDNILEFLAVLNLLSLSMHGIVQLLEGGLLCEGIPISSHILISLSIIFRLIHCIFCCNPFIASHDIGSAVIVGIAEKYLIRIAVLIWCEYSRVPVINGIGIKAPTSTRLDTGFLQVFFEKDPGVYHQILALQEDECFQCLENLANVDMIHLNFYYIENKPNY